MNIIFLDIDGVLNSECFFLTRGRNMKGLKLIEINPKTFEEKIIQRFIYDINPYNLDILKEIINETNSKVVVISSWKRLKYFDLICDELLKLGLPIIDKTYDNGDNRGYGIKEYLKNNKVDEYVILDDEIFEDYDEELLSSLVKTNFKEGLTSNEKDIALKKIKRK